MNYDNRTLEALKKVPFFEGLGPSQVKHLLKICHVRAVPRGEKLCQMGQQSDRMFVVLRDRVDRDSGRIDSDDRRGDHDDRRNGALTGELRSVTVIATTDCHVLEINRVSLNDLLKTDTSMASRLYRNVMMSLRKKLVTANRRIDELMKNAGSSVT